MNMKEALDKNWQHFIVEGNPPGADEYGDCRLRTDGCLACAVGILISEDDYDRTLEGLSPDQLAERFPYLPNDSVIDEEGDDSLSARHTFLQDLQSAHDDASDSPQDFHSAYENNLRKLAERFSLEVPENG